MAKVEYTLDPDVTEEEFERCNALSAEPRSDDIDLAAIEAEVASATVEEVDD